MGTIEIAGAILMILVSIIITVIVMLQDSKGDGISSLTGTNVFMADKKGKTIDAKLNRIVKYLGILFVAITIVVYYIAMNK